MLTGGLSPFEGSDSNENLKFSIIFYVLPAHKISLQSDNFYFLAPNLRGSALLLRDLIIIKIQNFKLYFMFYLHTKFRCNPTTFIFYPQL